jgi:hypothetical protein
VIKGVLFEKAMAKETMLEERVHIKKICKGFPMFFTLKKFKTAFMGAI